MRRRPSLRRLALCLAALALVLPAVAWAHASLEREFPGFEQELKSSPTAVVLHFDQVTLFPDVQVYNGDGKTFAAGKATAKGLIVRVPLRTLPTGDYTVRWHVLSSDGHVVSGVWTFGVRERALPPTEAYGASGPTTTEHIVRWLYFVSFALLIGAIGFRLLMRGLDLPKRTRGRLTLVALIGVIGSIEVGIAAFCLRCEDVLQLPLSTYLYGDLTPIADGTRFGRAFIWMTLGFALVAALVYLEWLLERVWLLVPALLLSIGLLSGLSVSGHDGVDPGSSFTTELADWVHISAASLWIGGLVSLIVALWPTAPGLRRQAFVRFSRLATVLVALVLSAGIYLALVRIPHLREMWTTRYGVILLIKIGLVSTAVAWGGIHHFLVRPRLARASDGFLSRVGTSLAGEATVAIAVLLVAAFLVDSNPPPRPFLTPSPAQAVGR